MTLGINPSLYDIADEFSLARSTPFPSGFYGKGGAPASGPLSFADFNGRSNFAAEFTIGNQTSAAIGSTGRTRYQRILTATPVGGAGPFTYSWAASNQTGQNDVSLVVQSGANIAASSSWANDGSEGSGASATVTLTITDTSNGQTRTVSHIVSLA